MSFQMDIDDEAFTAEIMQEAARILKDEPALCLLLRHTVLKCSSKSWMDALIDTVCHRLLPETTKEMCVYCPDTLRSVVKEAFLSETLELGHTLKDAVYQDLRAIVRRDPAMDHVLQVIMFSKGFAAVVSHRVAHRLWHQKQTYTALFLQSQASAVFGVDIHPAAQLGAALLLDHGTGIVVGETAMIEDGCTILHGVTLGGTGKQSGDRHPKVGKHVLIGANASLLGNVRIGDRAKIGAGSVVLRDIPEGVTAVGAPAKIIGRSKEAQPGSDMDEQLENVAQILKEAITKKKQPEPPVQEIETTINPKPFKAMHSMSSVTDSSSNPDEENEDDAFYNYDTSCCPWRAYAKIAEGKAPPSHVSAHMLKSVLDPFKVPMPTIFSMLFELDYDNVGHVPLQLFRDKGAEILAQKTSLNADTIQRVVEQVVHKVHKQRIDSIVEEVVDKVQEENDTAIAAVFNGGRPPMVSA